MIGNKRGGSKTQNKLLEFVLHSDKFLVFSDSISLFHETRTQSTNNNKIQNKLLEFVLISDNLVVFSDSIHYFKKLGPNQQTITKPIKFQ